MKKFWVAILIGMMFLTGCGESERVTGIGDPKVKIAPIPGYTEVQSEAIRQELSERILYQYTAGESILEAWQDEQKAGNYLGNISFAGEFLEKNYEFAGLESGTYIEPLERDGQQWLHVTVKALFKQASNVFTYNDSLIHLMIPISVDADGKVILGKFYADTYTVSEANPQEHFAELGWNKKIIHLQTADVTHDGVQDFIQTVIWVAPDVTEEDPNKMLRSAGVGYVEVYDGSTASGSGDLGVKIWEQEFADARPGNIQVSLVHRGGLDYLLLSNIDSQFGTYYFQYRVQSLDRAGREYIIDDREIFFDNIDLNTHEQKPLSEEQKEEIRAFQEQISSWFEGAELLVAADSSLDAHLVSVPDRQYTPQQYYDRILPLYLN